MVDDALHRQFLETGSEEALNLLMQKHYKAIRAHVFRIVENDQDADEITNETFLKAFEKRKTIKDPERLVGWFYITAKHLAIDRLRDRQRDVKEIPQFVSLDNLDGEVEAASMLAAEQAQQAKTDQDLLKGLLRLLPEKDLEVVEHFLDDLKPKQIAEAIGSTAEAVQKRWERMREVKPNRSQFRRTAQ